MDRAPAGVAVILMCHRAENSRKKHQVCTGAESRKAREKGIRGEFRARSIGLAASPHHRNEVVGGG